MQRIFFYFNKFSNEWIKRINIKQTLWIPTIFSNTILVWSKPSQTVSNQGRLPQKREREKRDTALCYMFQFRYWGATYGLTWVVCCIVWKVDLCHNENIYQKVFDCILSCLSIWSSNLFFTIALTVFVYNKET